MPQHALTLTTKPRGGRRALVLRLLRHDASKWWYFRQLRAQGQTDRAIGLERASIRSHVRAIRTDIGREVTFYRTDCISFDDRPHNRPFDLREPITSYTAVTSGCHPGFFAAFVYCYAHRIGLKFRAKSTDLV